jgi:hypothetical protein
MNEPVETQPLPIATPMTAAIVYSEPSIARAVLAGFFAALVGAVLWAVITVALKAQIGFMAIGVGLLVAWAVRTLGKGSSPTYGVIGAVFALFGCVLGNLLAACGFLATGQGAPLGGVTLRVLSSPSLAFGLLQATFNAMDVLFDAIAAYEGYKLARRAKAA